MFECSKRKTINHTQERPHESISWFLNRDFSDQKGVAGYNENAEGK